ncbi:MAG: Ig-like domain-containing protein [Ferruginibacter sp.]
MKKTLLTIQLLYAIQLFSFSQITHQPAATYADLRLNENSNIKNTAMHVSSDWKAMAQQYIAASEYFFRNFDDQYAAANRSQKIGFATIGTKVTIHPLQFNANSGNLWNSSLELIKINKPGTVPVSALKPKISFNKNHLLFKYEGFEIEYLNNEAGLRQNFIINSKPEGQEKLQVHLKVTGDLIPSVSNGKTLVLSNKETKEVILKYDDLKVWDAKQRILPAFMELRNNNELVLVVDDADAVYPVTVDPLTHSAEWTTSADGVLPGLLTNLQLQIDALYGYNVAGLGDINGDGYDDIAIGAPGAIDIIAGPTTVVGAGAVFVYFGSPTGTSTTPDKVLRATTAITNALFGFSVAGGNVSGDGRNDIIVGAPGESYTANVSGIPSTANVTAGKVYVFRGEDLSAAGNPAPLLSVYLNGSSFFSNGVFGVLTANVSVNALFGFSVSATEDMNGDGLGEVIVGSPGYASPGLLPLLPVSTGTAVVYYSTNLATNTPVRLTAPTAGLLGIPLITNGLLFGFSVDGLGDYNQDGYPDVVVGAPAGISLTFPDLLGGSAYVYYGNNTSTGVNTTVGTKLSATPSLINTIANLFGYSVRGTRNANGIRNGSVVIGAPAGNLLSNIVGGLRLKTGSVCVFPSKASPGSAQIPDQTLLSPRGTSLLSILVGQNLDVSALFGASIDNMLDVNCDGLNDIIVGEPLSTGVGLINTDAVGGAVNIFLGKADGTYNATPFWTLQNDTDFPFGINAGSLLGYSVAGARHVRGPMQGVRALIGAPGAALDFSTGIFNLGATFGTLFSFTSGNNGLGKSYLYGFDNCGVRLNPDVNATWVNIAVPGDVNTNDIVPAGTTYGTPVPEGGNPAGGSINMNPDGTYSFTSTTPGVFYYQVPVCIPGEIAPCATTELKITVLDVNSNVNPPVANTDIAMTMEGVPVILYTLSNDKCSNVGCSLNAASVLVTVNSANGSTSVNPANGNITYTPDPGFTGKDTLTYQVCDDGSPVQCVMARQIITVLAATVPNITTAADDYVFTQQGVQVNGDVKINDTDPEGNIQTVTAQVTNVPGVGILTLNNDGSFDFVPEPDFYGPVDFPYTTCDDGTVMACANATLHILVNNGTTLPITISGFTVKASSCDVVLQWNFDNQINGDYTEVEKSDDGISFSSALKINFNGSSSGSQSVKIAQVNNTGFYRLKITDNDGRFRYSETQSVKTNCTKNEKLDVVPSLFTSSTTVVFTTNEARGTSSLMLYDMHGRKIMAQAVNILKGTNRIALNGISLSNGMYYVRIEGKGWVSESIKVIKR